MSEKSQEIREMIKAERARLVDYYQNQARVWRSIKRKTKKDGGDFANLKQNFEFENGVEGVFEDVFGDGDTTLKIYYDAVNENGREIRDVMFENLYESITERDPKYAELEKAGRIVGRGTGLKDFYQLTPEEAFENFEKHAEKADKLAELYANADEVDEIGVEMFELLTRWVELKHDLENRGNDAERGIWGGCYSPVRRVLEKTILPSIR